MASLPKVAVINYLGQGYATLVAVVMFPFYLKYLGAEAYGLVGFFTILQAWFALMDVGLSPTLTRQVAHTRGQSTPKWGQLRDLIRSIEIILGVFAVVAVVAIAMASSWMAGQWLKVNALPLADVSYCISLMGAQIGLRAFASLYRGGIQGMERLIWLNNVNIVMTTLRFVGVMAILQWVSRDVRQFFHFQLAIAFLEVYILVRRLYTDLPDDSHSARRLFSMAALRPVLPFAGGLAYTTALWILLTQADKLILSKILSLREFGYFTIVVVIANGVFNLTGPISQVLLPRMTFLFSKQRNVDAMNVYHRATQTVCAVIFPIIAFIAVFAKDILLVWTGDWEAASWSAPLLPWFLAGNALLCIAVFPYVLQNALGTIRLHVIISSLSVLLQLPIILYAAYRWGAIGVGIAWFFVRIITFFVNSSIVHLSLASGYHTQWLLKGIAPFIPLTALPVVLAESLISTHHDGELLHIIWIFLWMSLSIVANLFLIKLFWRQLSIARK